MAKHKKRSTRKAAKTRDLPVRKAGSVKGGTTSRFDPYKNYKFHL